MLVSLFKPCLAEFALSFRVTSWVYLKVQESNPVNSEATHFFIISLFSHFVFLQAAKCSKLFVCRIQTKSNSSAFDHKKSKELNKCLKFRSVSSSSINFRHLLCVVFISKSVHCHGVPGGQSVSAWAVQVHHVVPLAFPVTAMADRADDEASRISVAVRCRPLSDHAPRANTETEKT